MRVNIEGENGKEYMEKLKAFLKPIFSGKGKEHLAKNIDAQMKIWGDNNNFNLKVESGEYTFKPKPKPEDLLYEYHGSIIMD